MTEDEIKTLARRCARLDLREARHLFETIYATNALHQNHGRKNDAARQLQCDRTTLYKLIGKRHV